MALKPDRKITDGTDISYFMNTIAERGIVVVLSAGGSGAAMDDAAAVAAKPSALYGSGQYPLGILLNDVVSGDLTKTHLNYMKDEVQVGGKVTILRRGVVVTNMVEGTPSAGQMAYIGGANDGKITGIAFSATSPLAVVGTGIQTPQTQRIGTWLSSKDADGYAKLEVNLI